MYYSLTLRHDSDSELTAIDLDNETILSALDALEDAIVELLGDEFPEGEVETFVDHLPLSVHVLGLESTYNGDFVEEFGVEETDDFIDEINQLPEAAAFYQAVRDVHGEEITSELYFDAMYFG